MAVPEASLRSTKYGLVPDGDGWFVLNARDTRWRDYGSLGAACDFGGKRPFKQLGINLNVLEPGDRVGGGIRQVPRAIALAVPRGLAARVPGVIEAAKGVA